jgi:hypothetical protein
MYVHYLQLFDYFLVFVTLDTDILELLAHCWCLCELVHLVPMISVD